MNKNINELDFQTRLRMLREDNDKNNNNENELSSEPITPKENLSTPITSYLSENNGYISILPWKEKEENVSRMNHNNNNNNNNNDKSIDNTKFISKLPSYKRNINHIEMKDNNNNNEYIDLKYNLTYENAFRIVQEAIYAETIGKNPLLAIELYADAGDILIKVGKNEKDILLKEGMKNKAYELLQRAEELEKYMISYNKNNNINIMELPLDRIHYTEIPFIENTWNKLGKPPYNNTKEFTHMSYTAVTTSEPIDFTKDSFILRTIQYKRTIRTFITITMYNEEGNELKSTLLGIVKNLKYMENLNKKINKYNHSWENICVAIISDGKTKASSSCLDYLHTIGLFDEEIMNISSLGIKNINLHLFEGIIQLSDNKNYNNYYPPLQIIFALKEKNAGKLNSHLWFFNAFAEQLNPLYTVLIDVGTIPGDSSIYKLIRSMDRNEQIGGVAGEIAVEKPNYFNPIVASQHFEYKISNIMDKSLESIFGFISVLPGAFSAYRFSAIRCSRSNPNAPLAQYFKSLTSTMKELGPFEGNMYLAEDRILCFNLLINHSNYSKYTMHYVKDAIAKTDVPEDLLNLIKQRRRWLNGSFFASIYSIINSYKIWKCSNHTILRKIILSIQFFYIIIQNILSFFLISNFFLTYYYVLTIVLFNNNNIILTIILGIYMVLIGGIIIFALGNKPEKKGTGNFYLFSCIYYGLLMFFITGITIYSLFNNNLNLNNNKDTIKNLKTCSVNHYELKIGILSSIGFIFLSAFIHGECSILLSFIQYFFMLPTYVNILGIYAYSNLHDLSWGTKGLEDSTDHNTTTNQNNNNKGTVQDVVKNEKIKIKLKMELQKEKEQVENSFRIFRSSLLLIWLVLNSLWIYICVYYISSSCFLKYVSFVVGVFNFIRFSGSIIFLFFRILRRFHIGNCFISPTPMNQYNNNNRNNNDISKEWENYYKNKNTNLQLNNIQTNETLNNESIVNL